MTDIVWSLRNDVPCNGDIGCAQKLCGRAADEIERLRAALREIASTERDSCSEWFQDIAIAALEEKS